MKRNKGITLIALIITIVVLLILAGVTVLYVRSDSSIVRQAEDAKLQTDIKSWQERLELAKNPNLIEGLGTYDPDKYFEDIQHQKYINDKDDDVQDNGDGTYMVTVVPGYVFKISLIPTKENPKDIKIEYIGTKDKLAPTIGKIVVTDKSSSSIAIEVTVNRLEDGKLSYYYKKDDEEEYHPLEEKQNTTDLTAEFTGLEQKKIYNIKVIAKNKKGKAEKVISEITGQLRTGTIGQKGDTIWTSNKASIELETVPEGLKMNYQVNGIDGTWTRYTGAIGNLDHKDKVYARITDGTNAGDIATIEIRDGTAPKIVITRGVVTTNSIAVTASGVDGQWGMPANPEYSYFIKKSTESSYGVAKYIGTNTSYTFTDLEQNTDYDIQVTTKDKAENEGVETLINNTTRTVGGASENLATGNIIASSPVWDNISHTASIVLTTDVNDMHIQWQKNGNSGTWTTESIEQKNVTISDLNHNDKIYARLYDGVNSGKEACVQVKDSSAPNVSVTKGVVITNSIAVTASASDSQWGMPTNPEYSYFIKKSTESSYGEAKYKGANTSYTFTGLAQNTNYDIRVTTKDKAGNEGTASTTAVTETVGGTSENLATGNITASSPVWNGTNHTASIVLSTVVSDMHIQWQKNGIAGEWTTETKGVKNITISNLKHNDKIYARLYDGVNSGSEAYVQVKDGKEPDNATIELGATSTSTEGSITAKVTHIDNQSGPKIASCKWVYNTISGKIGTTASSYTGGTFSSNGQTINLTTTTPGTYYLHVLTTDNAGNAWETVSSAITVAKVAVRKISINTKIQTYLQTAGNLPIIYSIVAEKDGNIIADEIVQCTMNAAGEKTTDFNLKVANGTKITIECQYMGVGYEVTSKNPQVIYVGDATTWNVEFIYNYVK